MTNKRTARHVGSVSIKRVDSGVDSEIIKRIDSTDMPLPIANVFKHLVTPPHECWDQTSPSALMPFRGAYQQTTITHNNELNQMNDSAKQGESERSLFVKMIAETQTKLEKAQSESNRFREERDQALATAANLQGELETQAGAKMFLEEQACDDEDRVILLLSSLPKMQGHFLKMRKQRDRMQELLSQARSFNDRMQKERDQALATTANLQGELEKTQAEANKAKSEAEARREHYKKTFLEAVKSGVEQRDSSEDTEQSCENEDHGAEGSQDDPKPQSPFWVLCSYLLPFLWYGLRPSAKEIQRTLAASPQKSSDTPKEKARASKNSIRRRFKRRNR